MRQLQRSLDLLFREPRIRAIIEDMQREADKMVAELWKTDDQMAEEATDLKREFVRVFPDADDSNAELPEFMDPASFGTFARFERLLKTRPRDKPNTYDVKDETLTGSLLRILEQKMKTVEGATATEEVEALRKRFYDLSNLHRRVHARFVDDKLTSGSVALRAIGNYLSRALDPVQSLDSLLERAPKFSTSLPYGMLEYDLHDRQNIGSDTDKGKVLARHVSEQKARLHQFHEELRLRIGSRLSLVGLINRFQHRCQWHDRVRLYSLAENNSGKAEELLTAELALWLFDNGMSPVPKPMMAGLQPDLTDPSFKFNLYVEAKQYSKGAKPYLIKGFHQLWDTVSGLQGTPYEVHEAFYIVFRRGGPRYVLPPLFQGEGWTAHLRLIDIAPTSERGSKGAQKPELISAEELLPTKTTK